MVARGARFENGARLAQLGRDVDLSVAEAALAAFDSPADFPAIMGETEASLARFKDKLPPDILAAKAAARGMIAANAAATQRLARLWDVAPALVSAIPAVERRRARAIAEFADLGLPPARAVELAAEKPAGVGEDDKPASSAGDDTLMGGGDDSVVTGGDGDDTLIGDAGGEGDENPVQEAEV